jgi:hypothetical protein
MKKKRYFSEFLDKLLSFILKCCPQFKNIFREKNVTIVSLVKFNPVRLQHVVQVGFQKIFKRFLHQTIRQWIWKGRMNLDGIWRWRFVNRKAYLLLEVSEKYKQQVAAWEWMRRQKERQLLCEGTCMWDAVEKSSRCACTASLIAHSKPSTFFFNK